MSGRGSCIAGHLGPFETDGWLRIDDGRIVEVGHGAPPRDAGVMSDAVLAPGFVDLQVNGVGAVDFGTADEHAIAIALDAMTNHGTTGCLPTIVTAPLDSYDAMLTRIGAARRLPGAEERCTILGAHMEGPFLGGAPGAHSVELIRPVDVAWIASLLERHRDLVTMMTLAPEADAEFQATRLLAASDVLVSLGHSNCSLATALAAADAGASAVTHLYNGMSGLHHRDPGLATAALTEERLTPTVIADFQHVHVALLRLAFAARTRLALVTDAVAPDAGSSGGLPIAQRDGAVYLADGTLAGSLLTMDAAVRNVVSLGVPLSRALEMAATVPCDLIGSSDRGRFQPGARADIVALDRDTLHVQAVWMAGARLR